MVQSVGCSVPNIVLSVLEWSWVAVVQDLFVTCKLEDMVAAAILRHAY